jgi:hypothetical protein
MASPGRPSAAPAPAAKRLPDITADIVAVGGGTALQRTGAEAAVDGRRDS